MRTGRWRLTNVRRLTADSVSLFRRRPVCDEHRRHQAGAAEPGKLGLLVAGQQDHRVPRLRLLLRIGRTDERHSDPKKPGSATSDSDIFVANVPVGSPLFGLDALTCANA